jgi:hypothetical protein
MLVKYTPAFGNMSEFPRDEMQSKEERLSRVPLVIVFGFRHLNLLNWLAQVQSYLCALWLGVRKYYNLFGAPPIATGFFLIISYPLHVSVPTGQVLLQVEYIPVNF